MVRREQLENDRHAAAREALDLGQPEELLQPRGDRRARFGRIIYDRGAPGGQLDAVGRRLRERASLLGRELMDDQLLHLGAAELPEVGAG